MIESTLAIEYVDNIPWSKYPAFAFSNDTDAYMTAFKNVVERVPVGDMKISFEDDVWDFNHYFYDVNDDSLKIQFQGFPEEIRDYCKFFVLHRIMNRTKISTANVRASDARSVITRIIKDTNHKSAFQITTEDIVNEINRRNVTATTAHNLYESVVQLYDFMINNYKLKFPVEIETLKQLGIEAKKLSKKTLEEDKLPNIPEEYYDKIIDAAKRVMRSGKEEPYNMRATACLIIILSQVGMRLGDLLALTTDRMHSMFLKSMGKNANYIRYRAHKPSKARSPVLEFDVFATELCAEAFNKLKEIRKECSLSKDNDFLYVLDGLRKPQVPISNPQFNTQYKHFLQTYLSEDCHRPWEGISPTKVYCGRDKETKELITDVIYTPDTRQYRVHLCTALYEEHVSLVFIQKYLGHLSEYMMGYYVRPKDTVQEDLAVSEAFIQDIVINETRLLGGDGNGDDIVEAIRSFIDAGKYNIYTDIDEIMESLGDKLVLRGKLGGMCIKTSLIPCAKDKRTNNVLCALQACPNLFHTYYMIDIVYLQFCNLQKTFKTMIEEGKVSAAKHELVKIKDLIHRRLLPELDDLDRMIKLNGESAMSDLHPAILDVIENRAHVREEAEEWLKTKVKG